MNTILVQCYSNSLIYIYICIYLYMCIYICIYIYMYIYVYVYVYVCICICMYMYIYMYTYTYIWHQHDPREVLLLNSLEQYQPSQTHSHKQRWPPRLSAQVLNIPQHKLSLKWTKALYQDVHEFHELPDLFVIFNRSLLLFYFYFFLMINSRSFVAGLLFVVLFVSLFFFKYRTLSSCPQRDRAACVKQVFFLGRGT